MFTGSPALSNEGTVYRESNDKLHDLDWQVPKELEDNWLDLVKSTFPDLTYKINPKTNQAQVFSKGEKTTHTLIIKGMPVDFFININPSSNKNTFGDMRWQDTFEAKMDIGRNKDIRDLIDFKTSFNDYFSNPNYLYYSLGQIKPGVQELFESNPELANAVYSIMGLNTINKSEITYTDEEGNPCAKVGLTNTTKGTGWKIVKDFKGKPKHNQGGVDITISDKGVSMRKGGKDIKAAHGLLIPNNN
jgi:hypothetical protein